VSWLHPRYPSVPSTFPPEESESSNALVIERFVISRPLENWLRARDPDFPGGRELVLAEHLVGFRTNLIYYLHGRVYYNRLLNSERPLLSQAFVEYALVVSQPCVIAVKLPIAGWCPAQEENAGMTFTACC
jgi:hypothetical protein